MPLIDRGTAVRRGAGFFSAVLLVACLQPAQSGGQGKPAGEQFRISGTVINAATGEPIQNAAVAVLSEEADGHIIESVFTDNDGRFVLAGLAAAKYQLTASKRGYRTAFYDEHDEYSSAIVTGPGLETGGLTFRLTPGAVVRGVVTADGGDPVENARVMLFKRPHGHKPGARVAQVDTQTTDDTGAYEFSNLAEGEYLVAVTAEPWYAMHLPAGNDSDGGAALDVAYPITFFDSTTDEASATPITVTAGSTQQADISLHAVQALNLKVMLPRRADGGWARPELRQSIFGVQTSAESIGLASSPARNWVEFTGVAPGHYELMQGDPPRLAELDASTSEQVDPTQGTPTVEVRGTLKPAAEAALPADMTLMLEPAAGETRGEPMQSSGARGSFRFSAVPPGKWTVSAQTAGRQLAVLAVTSGGTTHAGNEITVSDRSLQVTLSVSVGSARVEGIVRRNGKGVAGAMVMLVPRNLAAIAELARRDQSDSDGSFSLRDAIPGQYTVVAIEHGWDLDWARPETIRRFLPRGTSVTVTDAGGKGIRMSEAVELQSP